jgi:ubiquinone/menaquinone biosynthesis C-methylase UbiE
MSASGVAALRKSKVGEEEDQKDYYDKSTHYDTCWGLDNIHLGYYPNLSSHFPSTSSHITDMKMSQAAFVYNAHMINIGQITNKDTVIDLGCGKGHGPLQIAKETGCKVVGLDIGTVNIVRAKEVAAQHPNLDLTYVEGSFTAIPAEIRKPYSVVFAQLAINHNHADLPAVLEEVKAVMAPGGRFVISDYLGCDGEQSEETKENVMKRLHFDMLYGHRGWRKVCEDAGFYIQYYENLDDHMVQSYRDLSKVAHEHGFLSADGAKLGDNYAKTAIACEKGEIGMNLAVLTLGRRSKL